MVVPCHPPNVGCAAGETCIVNIFDPSLNHCEGGIDPCGDANEDCYDDCTLEKLSDDCDDDDEKDCYELCDAKLPIDALNIGNIFGNPLCKIDCWIKEIFGFVTIFIVSFIISAVLLFILSIYIPPVKVLVTNWILFLIVAMVMSVLLYSIFTIPITAIVGSLL